MSLVSGVLERSSLSDSSKPSFLRLDITLTSSSPELLEHLLALSPRARGERLRFLAQLGLVFLRGGVPVVAPVTTGIDTASTAVSTEEPGSSDSAAEHRSRPVSSARRRALHQLGNSLGETK